MPVLFAIIKLPCEAVDSVSATVGSDGCLQVDWERPALQSSWTVRLVMPDGSAIVQPTDTNHWEYCGLAPNQHYTVYVRSRCDDIDGNSWSDWSEGFSASATLAISDIESQDIKLSPNPATDEVSIDSPLPMTLVEAYDEKGACILRQELNTQHSSLNTKGWSSGAYVLRIHTQQGVATKRLTVMR